MEEPRRPAALTPGDRIGVVAPSSPFLREPFDAGVAWLTSAGFEVCFGPDVFERHHYVAGRPETRVAALHAHLEDPHIRAIFCARGGYGSMQLLPFLDWGRLRAHPKLLVGYSDGTPLINCALQRAGVVSVHGPVLTGIGAQSDEESLGALLGLLTDWRAPAPALDGGVGLVAGRCEGICVGGNLALVAATLGTPWQVETRGRILCLEEVGERPFRVDRMLTQLKLAGVFEGVRGVAFGTFSGCEEPGGRGRPMDDVILEVLGELGVPICWQLPFGHVPRNIPFPLGVMGELDGARGALFFRTAAVTAPVAASVGVC